ncbi:MAG: hypothetical protein IKB99_11405, partial [Lentisphaeria bacterium]|nr:hypothetical protein [Lentisphaeria bacterium]
MYFKSLCCTFFLCFLLIFSSVLSAQGIHIEKLDSTQRLTLSSKGVAQAVIVLPPRAGKILLFAADELRTLLKEATGADFPVVTAPQAGKVNLFLGETFLKKVSLSL